MIVIVGAGGFLGYSLSRYLSRQKTDFVTISRSFQWLPIMFERRFVGSASDVNEGMFNTSDGLQVLYMAGSPNLPLAEQDPALDLCAHRQELESFIEFFRHLHSSRKRFVFFSSGGTVYGDSDGVVKTEESLLRPKSAYGKRNAALEKFVVSFFSNSEVQVSIFRVTNPFGPGQFRFRRRGFIQALIDSASFGQNISVRGNGYQLRDYIYSDDLCSIVCRLLSCESLPDVINIASGFSYSGRQVVDLMRACRLFPCLEYVDDTDFYEVKDSLVSSDLVRSILYIDRDEMLPFRSDRLLRMCRYEDEEF